MNRRDLIDIVQTPDKAAKDMEYSIDWTSNESVRRSLMKMDLISFVVVKSCIECAAMVLDDLPKEDLEQAGIKSENLLRVAGGFTADA